MPNARAISRSPGTRGANDAGFAIPLALVVLVTLGFVGAAAAFMTTGDTRIASLYSTANSASDAATAGVEHGVANFQENGSASSYWPLDGEIDGYAYAVEMVRDSFDFDGDGDAEPVSCKPGNSGNGDTDSVEPLAPPDWRMGYEAKDDDKNLKYAWKNAYKEDDKNKTDKWKVKFEERWHIAPDFDVDPWVTDSAWVYDDAWLDDDGDLVGGKIEARTKWEIVFESKSATEFTKKTNTRTYDKTEEENLETYVKRTEVWKEKSGVWTATITEVVKTADSNKGVTTKWTETATDAEAAAANNWADYKYGQAAVDKPKGTGDAAWSADYHGRGDTADGKIDVKWKDSSPNLDRRSEFKTPQLDRTGLDAEAMWKAQYREDGTNGSGSLYKLAWSAEAPKGLDYGGSGGSVDGGGNGSGGATTCTLNGDEKGQPVYVLTSVATRGTFTATQRLSLTSIGSFANPLRLAWRAE